MSDAEEDELSVDEPSVADEPLEMSDAGEERVQRLCEELVDYVSFICVRKTYHFKGCKRG